MSLFKKLFIRPLARNYGVACREATKLMSEKMEHPLTLDQRIRLWLHLYACDVCERYGQQITLLRKLLSHFPHPEHPADDSVKLGEEARNRILEEIKRASAEEPGSADDNKS